MEKQSELEATHKQMISDILISVVFPKLEKP